VQTATESTDVARATHETVLRLGGLFMNSTEMAAAAKRQGLSEQVMCLRGRVAAAGEMDAARATELLGSFPRSIVRVAWRHSSALSAAEAAAVYAGVCAEWGHDHLNAVSDAAVVADLAEKVVDASDVVDLPLAGAWRRWQRPTASAARLAHALMLLRELRFGLHLAAIRANGLSIPVVVLASHRGVDSLRRAGWSGSEIAAAQRAARHVGDLGDRCAIVDVEADLGFSSCLGVLDVYAQRTLVDGLARVDWATRPG